MTSSFSEFDVRFYIENRKRGFKVAVLCKQFDWLVAAQGGPSELDLEVSASRIQQPFPHDTFAGMESL